jgi:predicted DNA-binding antitoxin AbrB/MazE fold protein
VLIGAFNEFQDLTRRFLPSWLRIRGGKRFPLIEGELTKTPLERLDLRPGERVRVKSREEIVRTLDRSNRNRGMTFDAEMLRYCGRQATVLQRVERIIDDKTGRMTRLRNPCIVLEGVVCTADYHRLCPRGIYPYWREIWLERVP